LRSTALRKADDQRFSKTFLRTVEVSGRRVPKREAHFGGLNLPGFFVVLIYEREIAWGGECYLKRIL